MEKVKSTFKKIKNIIKHNTIELIFILAALAFSAWLMFHTFSYNEGEIIIAQKAWSDFASHIPLIRSFSLGQNFPPEYPLFPGEPIRYHFLFYALVGILERIGLRIDYALNIPSSLSFASLIIVIYYFAKTLFKSRAVGVLSVIFFLFNSSLSFLEFLKTHPLSLRTLNDIIVNSTFPSFGPYDGKIISAFWNLNIYTNQRHLALPITILMAIVFFLLKYEREGKRIPKYSIFLLGLLLGILLFSHTSVFIMAFAVCFILFFLFEKQRKSLLLILFIGGLLSLPRVLFLRETATFIPVINLSYLTSQNLTPFSFFNYWFQNLGFSLILIPIGLILSKPFQRKVFLAFIPLFLIGHFIQLSPEIAGNHKFFNVFLIVGNMFTAYFLVRLWNWQMISKIIVPILVLLLTLSGIIDFFPIYNDSKISLADYPKSRDMSWILTNTRPDSVFLNTQYLYHPASIAGRKIFLGWPYFSWSQGYDTDTRGKLLKEMLGGKDKNSICRLLLANSIDYIEITKTTLPDPNIPPISDIFSDQFVLDYGNPNTQVSFYDVEKSCS